MRTTNSKSMSVLEAAHVALIKTLPCSVCDALGPSDAHHIKQGQHFTVVAVCKSCHQGPRLGWHGERVMWNVKKMDELDALAVTIRRAMSYVSA